MIKISIDPVLEEPNHALSREDVEAILDVVPGEWTHFVRTVHLSAMMPSKSRFSRPAFFSWPHGRLNVSSRGLSPDPSPVTSPPRPTPCLNVSSRGLSPDRARKEILREMAMLGLSLRPYKGNVLSAGQLKQIDQAAAPFLKELEARARNSAY